MDNRREQRGRYVDYQLKIRWEGYPDVRDIWQHLDELVKCPHPDFADMLSDYFE